MGVGPILSSLERLRTQSGFGSRPPEDYRGPRGLLGRLPRRLN